MLEDGLASLARRWRHFGAPTVTQYRLRLQFTLSEILRGCSLQRVASHARIQVYRPVAGFTKTFVRVENLSGFQITGNQAHMNHYDVTGCLF